jgi:Amt family ammonium transporter
MNTQVATAAALAGWLLVERIRDGHATSIGAASGAVAGLVAITPACAFLAPWAAVVLGLLAGVICSLAVGLKFRFNIDDSLDVVGVHFVGGIVGTLFIGLFSTTVVNAAGADGLFYGGGFGLLGKQALGVIAVASYSFIVTLILGFALERTLGFRITRDAELEGIDLTEHAETAYEFDGLAGAGFGGGAIAVKTKIHSAQQTQEATV